MVKTLDRIYDNVIREHFIKNRQMLFMMGPRQSGKTTSARSVMKGHADSTYFTWDNRRDRQSIVQGPDAVAARMGLDRLAEGRRLAVFDEIHKFAHWKTFLKGLFDSYPDETHILVTGSARLGVFNATGDSLMGRYFPYRHHPLSLAELVQTDLPAGPIRTDPRPVDSDTFDAFWRFGGFPEPFVRQETRFWNRWRRLRSQQLFRDELRDLTRIQELGRVELLAENVKHRVGQLTSQASLARQIQVSLDTARRWLATLEAIYYCFSIRPWHKNVTRALRKEPKYYLWDWSLVDDPGARAENLVASALLKAVHFWTDHGFGEFGLHFVRDKQKREVDFLVSRDGEPWFIAEVKRSAEADLSPHLALFQAQTKAPHAFQIALDASPVARDCFTQTRPIIVPARTFLAQLV